MSFAATSFIRPVLDYFSLACQVFAKSADTIGSLSIIIIAVPKNPFLFLNAIIGRS